MENYNILTIDPGIKNCGYAITDLINSKVLYTECISIFEYSKLQDDLRIYYISQTIKKAIKQYNVKLVIFEKPVFHTNNETFSRIMYVIGAILGLIGELELNYIYYSPSEIKTAIGCKGRDHKDVIKSQIQNLQQENYFILESKSLDEITHHEIDAIAVYITYLKKNNLCK
jgi:Holliday junction resolvasome RuvABC endonuclease subunit